MSTPPEQDDAAQIAARMRDALARGVQGMDGDAAHPASKPSGGSSAARALSTHVEPGSTSPVSLSAERHAMPVPVRAGSQEEERYAPPTDARSRESALMTRLAVAAGVVALFLLVVAGILRANSEPERSPPAPSEQSRAGSASVPAASPPRAASPASSPPPRAAPPASSPPPQAAAPPPRTTPPAQAPSSPPAPPAAPAARAAADPSVAVGVEPVLRDLVVRYNRAELDPWLDHFTDPIDCYEARTSLARRTLRQELAVSRSSSQFLRRDRTVRIATMRVTQQGPNRAHAVVQSTSERGTRSARRRTWGVVLVRSARGEWKIQRLVQYSDPDRFPALPDRWESRCEWQ